MASLDNAGRSLIKLPPEMMRVAVVGVGQIGKEHARIYASLPQVRLVGVADVDQDRGDAIARRYGVPSYTDYRPLLDQVEAVSVAVPTESHCAIACEFLRRGVSVLVEKPIARTLDEADEMIRQAAATGALLQVGHLERFNPSVRLLTQMVTEPKFFEVHRLGVFTERSLDIDVVLDLMIHDLDIVLSLVRAPVTEVKAVGVPILTSSVDIANARLEFADGCVANLTASRISREKIRKLRIFQPHTYISLDYSESHLDVVTLQPSESGLKPTIHSQRLEVEKYEPLRAQIESFLECVRQKKQPLVSGKDGRRALDLALAVVRRIEEHRARAGIG